ncbi:MAG: hypothetical protein KDK48_01015 [Chlamydiia bacterium]|nr:hypothetical protein [Chlamydiia bacterium]
MLLIDRGSSRSTYSPPTQHEKQVNQESRPESSVQNESEILKGQFETLLHLYFHSIEYVSGCGSRGQPFIDKKWNELQTFLKQHPEFAKDAPKEKKVNEPALMF